jgi:hypothetical protein
MESIFLAVADPESHLLDADPATQGSYYSSMSSIGSDEIHVREDKLYAMIVLRLNCSDYRPFLQSDSSELCSDMV